MRRVWKWSMVVWSALMLVWLVSLGGYESECDDRGWLADSCRDGEAVGMGISIIIILFVWTLGMVLLGIAWRVASPNDEPAKAPTTPPAPSHPAPSTPEGWHPDPRGENRLRWWDGRQWTEHVSD